MKVLFKTLIFSAFLFASHTVCAQNEPDTSEETDTSKYAGLPKKLKNAHEAYDAKEYHTAVELFKDQFSKVKSRKDKAEISFKMGESYRHMRECKLAANMYKRAFKMGQGNEGQYYYALMQKCQGEYEDAIVEFQEYKKLVPDDPRTDKEIEACKNALEWMENPTRYQVENVKELNSKQHDYGTAYAGRIGTYDEIYIGSMRDEATGKGEDGWTGQNFSDIFSSNAERKTTRRRRGRGPASDDDGPVTWASPQPLDETINTKDHEGVGVFDSRRRTLYFTRCIKLKNEKLGCSIYSTRKLGQTWQAPELIVVTEDSTASVGQPALSLDDEILYFVSDMGGTRGGMDIWMTTYNRRERKWDKPTNLGPKINTRGDERFPFVHDDGYLYFSSDGHPGMGGMDIFRVQLGENGMPVGEVENLKYPINTHNDDFAIVFQGGEEKAEKGFLTSDRKGTRGGYDIWSVYLVPLKFTIEGQLVSSKDGKPVPQATVRLDGTDGSGTVVNTDKDGFFKIEHEHLTEETSYKLNFEKQKFLTGTSDVTTIGVPFNAFEFVPSDNHYLHTFNIKKEVDPIEEPIILPNVFFETAKWNLGPESMAALDTVVQTLENNPTLVVELRSHTDYRDTDERNRILSQNRADTCVKYLIKKGIHEDRLVPRGMGEDEPYTIPEKYTGLGSEYFKAGTTLSERYIKTLPQKQQDIANQLNRRTDIKVLRDDFVPQKKLVEGKDGEKVEVEEGPKEPGFYTVEPRDNWATIAKKNNISIRDLRELNGGLRGARPLPGMVLKVVPGADYSDFDDQHYQVELRDDYKSIAKKLDMKKGDLEDLNPDISDRDLAPGMYIRIK